MPNFKDDNVIRKIIFDRLYRELDKKEVEY